MSRSHSRKHHSHHHHRHRSKKKRFLQHHWKQLLYWQIVAYVVVLFLWALPIPNPIKVLAVTFHELSHAVVAILTGGRVFGFAISPSGAGATFGTGGNFFLILIAGYIGSVLFGALLYRLSVRWRPVTCILTLEVFILASGLMGWLNEFTMVFGLGSMFIMLVLLWTPQAFTIFVIRLIGSACCIYAPLEVVGEITRLDQAPRVMGDAPRSDMVQLAEVLNVHPAVVGLVLFAAQATILFYIIRWTCSAGASQALQKVKQRHDETRQLLDDIHKIKPKMG
jgi:hypothetical protein